MIINFHNYPIYHIISGIHLSNHPPNIFINSFSILDLPQFLQHLHPRIHSGMTITFYDNYPLLSPKAL